MVCLFFSLPASSKSGFSRTDTELQALSNSPVWLKLLHYEKPSIFSQRQTSAINSDDFFLSKEGKTDSLAELIETLRSVSAAPVNREVHARCRFPARYLWLKSTLAHRSELFDEKVAAVECTEFQKWSRNGSITSISVVFATGYLGNPASYYGHTLLKFNGGSNANESELLDSTTNFGALVPQGENPAVYIVKGMFGGYQSNFTHRQYYYHDHNYTSLESRDLWEYELALTDQERDLIIAHSWELLGKNYTYFFFRKNCAYRMAEVLELVPGVRLIPESRPWTIPTSVMQNLNSIQRDSVPLVSGVTYHPSNLSEFHQQYQALSDVEKDYLANIVSNQDILRSAHFLSLEVGQKQNILDALLAYSFYRKKGDDNEGSYSHTLYQSALKTRFALPSRAINRAEPPVVNVREDRKPGRTELSVVRSSTLDTGFSITIRPAYYDSLDSGAGQAAHSRLSMLEAQITYLDDAVSIRQLDILAIESVNTSVSGLSGDNGATWSLSAGFKSPALSCQRCSRFGVEASKGISLQTSRNGVAGIALVGDVRDKKDGYGHVSAKIEAFGSYKFGSKLRIRWALGNQHFVDSNYTDRFVADLESRIQIGKNVDLRFSLSKNVATEARLSIGAYW